MARRSGPFVHHPARVAVISVGFAGFFGAIAGGRALLPPAAPMTWIVDDDGGAGVHFTDIQPALDAAVDGDLVLVHPGTYSSFTLVESLSIVGPAGGDATVPVGNAVGIAGEAAVADLWFRGFNATDCTGTLVLDSILFQAGAFPHATLTIQSCADVRVLAADAASTSGRLPAVVIDGSTVELVSCLLEGAKGASGVDPDEEGLPGGDALSLQGDSRVYVARSLLTGGHGGDTYSVGGSSAGDGGDGIEVQSGAELLLLGRGTDLVQGGNGGDVGGLGYGYGGDGGHGLRVKSNGSVRHSNVSFKGGAKGDDPSGFAKPGQPIKSPALVGSVKSPALPDPALERTAVAAAGGTLSVKLRTESGAFSRLFVGSVPIVQSSPGVFVDSLVVKEVSYALGNAPANGIVNASLPLDPTWTPGTVVYAQAMSIFPGGKIRRTNSVPIVVR